VLSDLIDPLPILNGGRGDNYSSSMNVIPIKASIGEGLPRDAVACINRFVVKVDARGEQRADKKSLTEGTPLCDMGAYEFTKLSCTEDAQRRFDQGDVFFKSCDENLETFELGSVHPVSLIPLLFLIFWRNSFMTLSKRNLL
jgi:hypothetical protein